MSRGRPDRPPGGHQEGPWERAPKETQDRKGQSCIDPRSPYEAPSGPRGGPRSSGGPRPTTRTHRPPRIPTPRLPISEPAPPDFWTSYWYGCGLSDPWGGSRSSADPIRQHAPIAPQNSDPEISKLGPCDSPPAAAQRAPLGRPRRHGWVRLEILAQAHLRIDPGAGF